MAKRSKSNVINAGKEALRQEIARYQKGGGLINTKARQTGRLERINRKLAMSYKLLIFGELWHMLTS